MQRALFLDRDGVINIEKNYVSKVEDFEFVEGVFDLCRLANNLGLLIIVITNQAGIGRGYYSGLDFQILTEWMVDRFSREGVTISKVYHCPYHPTAGVGEYLRESFDRKPNPGMLLRAKNEFDLDMADSILIGDKDSDIQAGIAAGVGANLLLVHDRKIGNQGEIASLHDAGIWLSDHHAKGRL